MRLALVLAFPIAAASADGQGTIRGIVADSVRAGALTSALLVVDGNGAQSFTRDDGTFEIRNVPAGTHHVSVLHPLLDSLGIEMTTPAFVVMNDSTTTLSIAVPSAQSLVRMKCGADAKSAIIGTISRADDENPPVDAEVRLSWTETQISKQIGVKNVPMSQSTKIDTRGQFRICNAPLDLFGTIAAHTTSDSSSAIAFTFGDLPLSIVEIALPSRSGSTASLSGTVVDTTGIPLQGVRVWLRGLESAAVSDGDGKFVLTNQPAGSATLRARKLGYSVVELPVTLSSRRNAAVHFRMARFDNTLPDVIIKEMRSASLDRVGFNRRAKRRPGSLTLGPDQMDIRRNRFSLATTLAESHDLKVDGQRVASRAIPRFSIGPGGSISSNGGAGCVVYILDGEPWPVEWDVTPVGILDPAEVGAIEVYSADETPRELPGSVWWQRRSCAHVVIWTRDYLRIGRAKK